MEIDFKNKSNFYEWTTNKFYFACRPTTYIENIIYDIDFIIIKAINSIRYLQIKNNC